MSSSNPSFRPPSQAQLALALAIVKSKPSNLTIRDYIHSIRQHIRQGKSPQESATGHRYLDSVAFWRQAYEKSEAAQTKLLDKVYELEQRNETLASRSNQGGPVESLSSAKRKAKSDGGPGGLPSSRKRAKTANSAKTDHGISSQAGLAAAVIPDFEIAEGPTATLLRQFHSLQKTLQRKLDPGVLVMTSVELCKAAETAVLTGAMPNTTKGSCMLLEILRVVGECYSLVVQAMRKLCSSGDANSIGSIIYHVVQLFRVLLARFHRYALSKIQANLAEERLPKKKPKQRSKTKSAEELSDGYAMDDATMTVFSQLLITMVISLDPSKKEQSDTLEGFMCFLLEHVGKILGVFVFKELRSNPELRVDAEKLPVPMSIFETRSDGINMTTAQKSAELESKYLIWVLKTAMAHVEKHQNSDPTAVNTSLGLPTNLADRARAKLQNTLLKGIFGMDDPDIGGSLRVSDMPADFSRSQLPKKDIPEWFSQEVWRLLGWDVLLKSC